MSSDSRSGLFVMVTNIRKHMEFFHTKLWNSIQEKLIVFLWIGPLVLGSVVGPLSIYVIFFTNFGIIPLLYLSWLIYDKETCNRGGRRSDSFRSLQIWNTFCDYFYMRLIKTEDLDPTKNYLFCSHPHGLICIGIFGCFGTEGKSVQKIFPDHEMSLLSLHHHCLFPVHREYLLLTGVCSASKESMNFLLSSKGDKRVAAILVPGGASEMLDSHSNTLVIHLKNRKGFIKVALRNGTPLVPVFTFGETEVFDQAPNPEGSWLRKFQNKVLKLTGIPIIVPNTLFPKRIPITVVVGSPIPVERIADPTQEEIDSLHSEYVDALKNLYYSHREKYAPNPNIDFTII